MLKKIILTDFKNFHKEETLEFSKGVNVFIGKSGTTDLLQFIYDEVKQKVIHRGDGAMKAQKQKNKNAGVLYTENVDNLKCVFIKYNFSVKGLGLDDYHSRHIGNQKLESFDVFFKLNEQEQHQYDKYINALRYEYVYQQMEIYLQL